MIVYFPKLLITVLLLFLIDITNSQLPTVIAPGSGNNNEPGDTSATLLLTPSGTKNYLENRKAYVNDMSNEISMTLSIKGRIFIPYDRYQYKKNTSEDQILLLVNIKGTKIPNQPSSFTLRNYLNNSITYRDLSYISIGPHTKDIDPTYGAPENPHLWDISRNTLIGVVSGLSFLLIIWFVAANKFPEGENFSTIIFFPLILIDFMLDIVVLGVHGRDLKWFYICGLVFLLIPIFFNIMTSLYLISNQLKSSRATEQWWYNNLITALVFAFLSFIDLEALNVITSRCAGDETLNARFTEDGRKRINRSIVIIAFIEDVPQLIIYVLYQRYTVIPAIIPILVLFSACIVLLFKICYRGITKELDIFQKHLMTF
ncbi:hypothetical protein RclHR1_00980012 [Rhizophagus clarus]|uniref:Glycosyltransferase family 2 protein n=1 Tax=Rhizophagus clarus TaxID=94130 RepID=A0A2Z6SFH5_9GLOM|nr:hypothetical protein RclHR1_00980012 [Rhizophagus clarus]GES81159.1 glycosyltransferase family 2 protein [Rhizophagus clarus]